MSENLPTLVGTNCTVYEPLVVAFTFAGMIPPFGPERLRSHTMLIM